MMQLEYAGRRFDIPAGELGIGSGPEDDIRVAGEGILAGQAVVQGAPDGSAVIRRGSPDAVVAVNGVHLGPEPAPLLHGDRIQIGPAVLVVADPRTAGSTQFVSTVSSPGSVSARGELTASGSPMTGGRLVSLTDGREYQVAESGISFGRDAAADVVLEHVQVSRRHAEISFTPRGYVLSDSSTNGTWVNGERIEGGRLLERGDIIRMGQHEFRFYAEAKKPGPTPAPGAPAPPAGAVHRLNDTMHGLPATPPRGFHSPGSPGAREVSLASLLVRSGPLKGQRLPIRSAVANIGRGDYNDLVIADDSVSGGHAKLQRREGVWILTDQGSTNGTFVDGERVQGEYPLSPGATLRFGKVSMLFEPSDDAMPEAEPGTRILEAIRPAAPASRAAAGEKPAYLTDERPTPEALPRPEPRPPTVIRRPPAVVTPASARAGGSGWWVGAILILAAAVAAVYYFFLR